METSALVTALTRTLDPNLQMAASEVSEPETLGSADMRTSTCLP